MPEVYDVHSRTVDREGYLNLHTNRYSAPEALIDRRLVLRESLTSISVYDGHRLVCEHPRQPPGARKRKTLPEHRGGDRWRRRAEPRPPSDEEQRLRALDPALAELCDLLKKRSRGGAQRALSRLHRIYVDYPTDAVLTATRQALRYGLSDLGRIETMVLRAIAGDFFRLPIPDDDLPSGSTPHDDHNEPDEPDEPDEPNDDQGEDDVYDPKDSQEDAPEPGASEHGGRGEPAEHGGGGEPGAADTDDADVTTDDERGLGDDEHADDAEHRDAEHRGVDADADVDVDLVTDTDPGDPDDGPDSAGEEHGDDPQGDDLDLEIVIEDDEPAPALADDNGDDGDDDAARG